MNFSRFEISQEVVEKWYDDDTSYSRILENPYIISEESELNDSRYVTTEMVDLGVIQTPKSKVIGFRNIRHVSTQGLTSVESAHQSRSN